MLSEVVTMTILGGGGVLFLMGQVQACLDSTFYPLLSSVETIPEAASGDQALDAAQVSGCVDTSRLGCDLRAVKNYMESH